MGTDSDNPRLHNPQDVLESLLRVGVNLSAVSDRGKMLEMILSEARHLARADAGSLYVKQGRTLRFVAVQNDRADLARVAQALLGKEIPISNDSLVGFAAATGQVVNIADTDTLPPDTPFHVNRSFDAGTGYHAVSMLTIPLNRPDGDCVGVLQLCSSDHAADGPAAFAEGQTSDILSLASMAAVTIHNSVLQDQLKQAHLDTVFRLSVVVEYRDTSTGEHIHRISRLSKLIATALGLDAHQIELVERASPMHDIGKVSVPDAILQKPGALTAEERRVMERHTIVGADILGQPQNDLMATAREVALTHHERWDGSGYPYHLAGDRIPLSGRIVGVADVFDALLTRRCYKEALPLEGVLDILRLEKGRHFDPEAAEAFFRVVPSALETYGRGGEPARAAVR